LVSALPSLAAFAVVTALYSAGVDADTLSGARRILCSPHDATLCLAELDCMYASTAELNIPPFFEIDLDDALLSTTAASDQNRTTSAEVLKRIDDRIILHGYENGRAFSMIIQETTGQATFAAVTDNRSVIVFGSCTPLADE
jgi:hypothetical protein